MKKVTELKTDRLCLRKWRKEDYPLFAKLNADPLVMKYFPRVLTEDESHILASKIESAMTKNGWGFWALELIQEEKFIGFVGLNEPSYKLPVSPCTEIGWRLSRDYWGKGYATEAAKDCLAYAFDKLGKNNIYSFTAVSNKPSSRVMERIGMRDTNQNFDHPMVPENDPLRKHVLYSINKAHWEKTMT